MDCRDAADLLAPWADGQLSPGEEELFAQHLRRCRACRARAEAIAAQEIRPPKVLPLRQDAWARMDGALAAELDRMDEQPEAPPAAPPAPPLLKRRIAVPLPALLLYAAALLLAAGWGLLTHQQLQESRAQTAALRLEQEREKRLAVQPASPPPQPQVYRLTKDTPTRGMF